MYVCEWGVHVCAWVCMYVCESGVYMGLRMCMYVCESGVYMCVCMSGCAYGRVCVCVAEAEGCVGGGEVKRCLEEEPISRKQ